MSNLETVLGAFIRDCVREAIREDAPLLVAPRSQAKAQPDDDRMRRYVSVDDAGAIASVSAKTIHRWIARGGLPAYRVGAVVRVRVDELRSFIERPPDASILAESEIAKAIIDGGTSYKKMVKAQRDARRSKTRKR
jgi:excisionase family DNA binding protein